MVTSAPSQRRRTITWGSTYVEALRVVGSRDDAELKNDRGQCLVTTGLRLRGIVDVPVWHL